MIMKRISLLTLVFAFSPLLYAQASEELTAKLKAIETLEASFSQTIIDDKEKLLDESYGHMIIKRPGRFYWKSERPDELMVVADGQVIWTYDIELEQVVKQDQAESLGQSPAALLAGEVVDLGIDYQIEKVAPTLCRQDATECFNLIPKSSELQFKLIQIGFKDDSLVMIFMQDALDQSIDTQLSDTKINGPVDTNLFKFTPPKGVDVIEGKS